MATLYVREIPEDVYQAAKDIAAEHDMSLNAYITTLLEEAIQKEAQRARAKQALENIKRNRIRLPEGALDPVQIIRQIRDADGDTGDE